MRFHVNRRSALWVLAGSSALAAVDAVFIEPSWLELTHHTVAIEGLPHGLEGLKIAQVTDAHLRRLGRVEEDIVAAVRANDVQLVVLTGDIVDEVENLPLVSDLCRQLTSDGRTVIATLGNWEYWARLDLDDLRRTYRP